MDPRLVKGLVVLLAVVLYTGAGHLPPDLAEFAREAAMLLFGWQGLRRHGDLGPLPEGP